MKDLLKHPEKIGIRVGFKDMTRLHGKWIREIVFGKTDYTLQAHRGSYKSSSLAVSIALIMVLDPTHNIIFLRKADNDVAEMLRMVVKILRSQIMNDISNVVNGVPIEIVSESMDQVSTSLLAYKRGRRSHRRSIRRGRLYRADDREDRQENRHYLPVRKTVA